MGDEVSVLEFSSNPKTQEHTGDILRTSLEEVIDIIQNVWLSDYEKYGYGRFAVIYKPDNKLIGFCGFKYLPELNETDLGYRFLPEYWGMGIATESSIKMLEYGFSVLKLSNVFGTVFPQNIASSNVLKKLGFTYKGLKPYPTEELLGDLNGITCLKKNTKQKNMNNKKVIYWLLIGCTLIFIMVVVGGITRLTHSGLSISNYKLISGTLPPMNEAEWTEDFDLYKQYPEFQKINSDFNLQDFKDIYFWEWIHRVIGRFIGMVFLIPFLYFLVRKQLSKVTVRKCLILLGLGGFQGFLGWYMVISGLVDNPDVSHYRLAMHLTTAFITFA